MLYSHLVPKLPKTAGIPLGDVFSPEGCSLLLIFGSLRSEQHKEGATPPWAFGGDIRKSSKSLIKTITTSQWRGKLHIRTSSVNLCLIPRVAGMNEGSAPTF